jgi:hypothetical protein
MDDPSIVFVVFEYLVNESGVFLDLVFEDNLHGLQFSLVLLDVRKYEEVLILDVLDDL